MNFQKGCPLQYRVGAEIGATRTRPPAGLTISKAVVFMTSDLEKRTVVRFPLARWQPAGFQLALPADVPTYSMRHTPGRNNIPGFHSHCIG